MADSAKNRKSKQDDAQRLARALERGEVPEDVTVEETAGSNVRKLDTRRTKLGQLNAN